MKVWEVGLDGAVRRAVGDEGCGIIIIAFSPGVGGGSLAPRHPRVQGGPTSPSLAWETSVTAQESPSPCQTCPATLSINPCCGFGALHPYFPIFCDGSMNNSRGVFTRAGCCLPCSGGPCAPGVTRVRSRCSQELAKNPIPAFSPQFGDSIKVCSAARPEESSVEFYTARNHGWRKAPVPAPSCGLCPAWDLLERESSNPSCAWGNWN